MVKNSIPKYILKAIDMRRRHANKFLEYDNIVSDYCNKNKIETEMVNCHAQCIGEPDNAYYVVVEDIGKHSNLEN